MAGGKRITSPQNYLRVGAGHWEAAKILYPHTGKENIPDNAIFFPFYNILGFSIELLLKAFLSGKGINSDQLSKRPYGHNLSNLFKKARELGLFKIPGKGDVAPTALEKIISIVGPAFIDMSYRYIDESNNEYKYISNMKYVWPVMIDLQGRVEISLHISGTNLTAEKMAEAFVRAFPDKAQTVD